MNIDKKILSIDSDDDNQDYETFSKYLKNDIKRNKNKFIDEINEFGDIYLRELENKKKNNINKAKKQISYILKYSNNKYNENDLNSYSFEDIKTIYNEIKIQKRPLIIKMFYFLFNINN